MTRWADRIPPMPTGRASEEPPTRFDQAVPEGWLSPEAAPVSAPAAKTPITSTQRLDVVIPGPLPPQIPVRLKPPESNSSIRIAIIAGCVGFVIGMAMTATMAMTIRPAPPACTSAQP